MNIIFPCLDDVSFEDGHAVFDAIVDGESVSCLVTESALSAASRVDHIIPKRDAFSIGQSTIFEAITRLIRTTPGVSVVLTWADLPIPSGLFS
ncbi:conserved protein of unknown function [Paraburkholderia dioscoreae]|jgi:hypothetical protein|uniref:DUF1488 domain-containing protein n=1 Tax=Paraburkholderia dioscoreae TaxID=2604047 RepID=A0A5Q4YYB5_9BURK|nr:conserved protein of unknown function [Paraburkholderia dioscoreae]